MLKVKTIWTAPKNTDYSSDIWAPEFHIIKEKCNAYFAVDNGDNAIHRMYILQNNPDEPFEGKGNFKLPLKLTNGHLMAIFSSTITSFI